MSVFRQGYAEPVGSLLIALILAGGLAPGAAQNSPQSDVLTVDVRVTDRTGRPLEEADVEFEGPSVREGRTDATGVMTFRNVTPGPYRIRVSHAGFLTLEKEVVIEGNARVSVEAALTAGEQGTSVYLAGPGGSPNLVSIPDLAESMLDDPATVVERTVGCAGGQRSRLILLRDTLPSVRHANADETLYVVAGEASVTIDTVSQAAAPGWLGTVPRGAVHSVVRRGRNPVILLSIVSGEPCEAAGMAPVR